MEKRKRPPLPLDASPQEKYDNLILTFFEEWQEYDGQRIIFTNGTDNEFPNHKGILDLIDPNNLGFIGYGDLIFYIEMLSRDKYIDGEGYKRYLIGHEYHAPFWKIRITFKGLNYCRSLQDNGKNSNRCFVAMSYQLDMDPIYNEGIVKAIEANHFRPIRVDKEHTENEQTINDFIIASIKQSRFCIADLTHQRNGVYFEAGYALGRGLKVIYTCQRDDHEKVHFDLKNMQIILYDTPEELREALDLKIQAFILD